MTTFIGVFIACLAGTLIGDLMWRGGETNWTLNVVTACSAAFVVYTYQVWGKRK